MPITIRDEHLEGLIEKEAERRGDKTLAKTLGDLAREYLTQMQTKQESRPQANELHEPSTA
jgi:hypothetical protein